MKLVFIKLTADKNLFNLENAATPFNFKNSRKFYYWQKMHRKLQSSNNCY